LADCHSAAHGSHALCGTLSFIPVSTRARHLSIPLAVSILMKRLSPFDWAHTVTECNVYEYQLMPKPTVTARMKATRKRGRPRKRWSDEVEECLKIVGK